MKEEIIKNVKQENRFNEMHPEVAEPKEEDVPVNEFTALKAIENLDPRKEELDKLHQQMMQVNEKLLKLTEEEQDPETLIKVISLQAKLKEHILKDYSFMLTLVQTMKEEDKNIFELIGKKYKLIENLKKGNKKEILFGK